MWRKGAFPHSAYRVWLTPGVPRLTQLLCVKLGCCICAQLLCTRLVLAKRADSQCTAAEAPVSKQSAARATQVGVYLPLYDLMAERWAPAWWAPLAAGSAARTVAVLSTSPLELVRTRMQARTHAQPAAHDVERVLQGSWFIKPATLSMAGRESSAELSDMYTGLYIYILM